MVGLVCFLTDEVKRFFNVWFVDFYIERGLLMRMVIVSVGMIYFMVCCIIDTCFLGCVAFLIRGTVIFVVIDVLRIFDIRV